MRTNPGVGHAIASRLRLIFARKAPFRNEGASGAPVFLVHGLGGSHLALRPLGRYLARALGRPVVTPRLGLLSGDIRATAARVYREIEECAARTDCQYVDVVGHSLGGLVGSYLLKQTDRGRLIRRVVTLGTPHRGTPSAWWGLFLVGPLSPSIWQMRPRGSFLRRLEAAPVPPRSEIVAVAGLEDAVVPARYALLRRQPRQRNRAVAELDHFGLIVSRAAFRIVAEVLGEAPVPSKVIPLEEFRPTAGAGRRSYAGALEATHVHAGRQDRSPDL